MSTVTDPSPPVRRRATPWNELLALLLLAGVVAEVAYWFTNAYLAQRRNTPFDAGAIDWIQVLRGGAQRVDPVLGALLAGVLLLVVLVGDGGRGRRSARRLLSGLVAVALVAAVMAAAMWLDVVRRGTGVTAADSSGGLSGVSLVLVRAVEALPQLVTVALCGFVAWVAFQVLGEATDDGLYPAGLDDVDVAIELLDAPLGTDVHPEA